VMQPTTLRLAANLILPLNAVTRKHAFLGTTGSGKTYAATKAAELMLAAGAQIVALDPVGVWWGLRLAGDGESEGIKIPVFGGMHGDLPLEVGAGALIADVICDRGISAVIDVSQFEYDTDRSKFSRDFARRLFFRKKSSPSAIHVFYEEAQNFFPQNPAKGEEQMVHNFLKMDKEGRNFGIGRSIISQRPQEISKRALNLTELVLAFQTNGPHERKAIAEWVKEVGQDVDMVAKLPKLKTGVAHAWSPSWLELSDTVHIEKKWTFNTSATPEVGEVAIEAKPLAPIDLEKIKADMAETIEKQKENDPDELKKRIKELERQARKPVTAMSPSVVTERVVDHDAIRRAVDQATIEMRREFVGKVTDFAGQIDDALPRLTDAISDVREAHNALTRSAALLRAVRVEQPKYTGPPKADDAARTAMARNDTRTLAEVEHARLPEMKSGTNGSQSAEQKILNAMAALEALGGKLTKSNIAFFSGYVENWRFDGRIADLREAGRIEVVGRDELALTAAGRALADATQSIRTLGELHETWLTKLPESESKALRALLRRHPPRMHRTALAAELDRQDNWRFSAVLNQLKSLGIASFNGTGEVELTDALFPEGLVT
jgi:uncharacterized protein